MNGGIVRILARRIVFSSLPLFLLLAFQGVLFTDTALSEKPQDEYKRIQKDLKTSRKKLASVRRKELSVLDDLRKTTAELREIERQLSAQQGKIKNILATISSLQEEIRVDSAVLQTHKERLKKRLRALLTLSADKDAVLILLSGEDISRSLRTIRSLRAVSAHDYELITRFKEELRVLAEKEAGLQKLFVELKTEEKKIAKLEDSLKDKKKEREALLVSVRKEKSLYENMVRELKESSNRLLSIIRESERRERELRKKKSVKAKPGTKEEEPLEDSDFLRMKGRLHWPVQGNVVIQYGTQMDPLFNLPVFRSGIHIKTSNSAPVKAVHEGKVVFADDFKGYGQLVIVNHGGGYHTLYGNLARIFLRNGAIIKENQTLGEAGESSTLGTSGLYFEVRYKGKPLDPQQWLRR
ncbi:MAG: peptidoglycan DD-metalloendopeptidase family protein [Alphaproteobacteria bacterium]|uniref:Peptidoglycan DD-metalloendopeptidase family protein n=1 Tax=Candidatus Nitrobium versatile TaxID=2884831 RepID=A0A953LXD0_9BACT|nr:peptidoglycan DD-metalloendopeptidase family protein [Candidatus Nitrobium versatile]